MRRAGIAFAYLEAALLALAGGYCAAYFGSSLAVYRELAAWPALYVAIACFGGAGLAMCGAELLRSGE